MFGKHFFRFSLITCLIIASLFITSCGTTSPNRKIPEGPRQTKTDKQESSSSSNKPANSRQEISSGKVDEVPWANDNNFKKAQQKNQTFKQMAAFRTVLIDPLPGEEENVHLAAGLLAGTVVQPGEVFSQNAAIGPYSKARGFKEGPVYIGTQLSKTIGGGVCKIASTLYNVVVLCDLQVVERHAHGMPVPYVPYGQDATVSYGSKDFKFANNTSVPILIWSQGIGNTLYIAFYSRQAAPRVEWHHKFSNRQPAGRVYQANQNLPAGAERVVEKGMDGGVIDSWVTVYELNGTTRSKALGQSNYLPMPEIVERKI